MPGFSLTITRDDISKDLARLKGAVKGPGLMRTIGVGMVGLAKETFNDAALRQKPWAAKKDGTPSNLKSREATLWRSIRVQSVTATSVTIGSDKPYAAIHHLGGESRPMPERPYLPVVDGKITKAGATRMGDIIEAVLKVRGKKTS